MKRNVPYETYDRHTVSIIVVHTPQLPKSTYATRHKNMHLQQQQHQRQTQQLLLLTIIGLWLLADYKYEAHYSTMGVSAAPQSCILCDKEDLKAKNPANPAYEEYLFEHQVTRLDAINALRALNETFYEGIPPDNSCKSVSCTKKVMKYCLGPQFINDHCWCELGHIDEGLPFVPHICYVGEKLYTAAVGSCFFYEEVKECCCAPVLANRWRHISSAVALKSEMVPFLWLLTISYTILILKG